MLRATAVAFAFAIATPPRASAAEAPGVPEPNANSLSNALASQEALRAYLQTQEQLRAMQLLLEKNRLEAKAAAEDNARQLAARLKEVEDTLGSQRSRELDAMKESNRVLLLVAGSFAMVGILAMACMVYFQWRTVSRLSDISSFGTAAHLLGPGALPNEARLLAAGPAMDSNQRLFSSLEQLEKRLALIETDAPKPSHEAGGNGSSSVAVESSRPDSLQLLLAKGQALLNTDRPEEALACFDEAISAHPESAEAFSKRATALERLNRLPEALEAYDRAIAVDSQDTMAYLQKGGLFNRMERFEEALRCYESALRAKA